MLTRQTKVDPILLTRLPPDNPVAISDGMSGLDRGKLEKILLGHISDDEASCSIVFDMNIETSGLGFRV